MTDLFCSHLALHPQAALVCARPSIHACTVCVCVCGEYKYFCRSFLPLFPLITSFHLFLFLVPSPSHSHLSQAFNLFHVLARS